MPIDFSQYVAITSAVGGSAQASGRALILRLMTDNVLLPTGGIVEFDDAAQVSTFFGSTSEEFFQAQFYFGYLSPLATAPSKISFARFSLVNVEPRIFGDSAVFNLSDFDTITDGSFTITLGGITEAIAVNFVVPPVISLTQVADRISDAIAAANVADLYALSITNFDTPASRFDFRGGETGAFDIVIVPTGSGTDLLPLLKWEPPGVRISQGIVGTTLAVFLAQQAEASNNFGSFAYVAPRTNDEIVESATWNDGENVKYMYLDQTSLANSSVLIALIDTLSGVGITLSDAALTSDFPWLLPSAIFASTPYATRRAAVQNYMFKQASLVALVTDTVTANTLDAIKVNYYGNTQQAGSLLEFYQRGFLQGLAVDPVDMGVFANEVFLKDSIGVSIINLLLAVSSVPASAVGAAQVLAAIQDPIEVSLFNGVISIGKTLNATQIAFVTVITGDENAYIQIQNAGYWIEVVIEDRGGGEFVAVYTLLYSKNDVIRKVEGSHLLI